ncbi:FliH/SctL family protein [Candidatus Paracaedibacter symbiosus]|uniref:FliH/SctL family protein n=1 Tax=Candidatus Paracaedibacter symbiosus TaxID=244582 RepID=UPI0005099F58|nr:FliH/SctL family protein [Candidatus Paracaedibacter symbiosus]
MTATKPFIFENDFDDKPIMVEPVLPSVPTFSEDELAMAKEVAYTAGVEEGRRLQQNEINAQILHLVTNFEAQLTQFIDSDVCKWQQLQAEAAQLAKTIALKICLTEIEQHAVDRVVTCLEATTKMLLTRPKINVQVHPDIASPLTESIKQMIEAGEINVMSDDTLAIYDCRFQWQEGGAEVILKNIQNQIDTYINQLAE